VEFGANTAFAYFVIIAILFWSSYKVFVIPFFALGAELTDDFNERTSLRVWSSVFMYCAVMIASAAPPLILEMTEKSGGSGTDGWHNVGLIFGVAIAITILICWLFTKGGELVTRDAYSVEAAQAEKENFFSSFFNNIVSLFKIKPTKFLVFSVLFWSIVSSMSSGGLVYIMTNIVPLSGTHQSTVFVVMSLAGIAWLPLINAGAAKTDKQKIYFSFMAVSAVGLIAFYFFGFASMLVIMVFVVLFQFGNSTFWTLYYSMMYDISELDEFITGKRREGSIAALMSFSQKLGAAIALWLTGTILEMGGYDGMLDVQSDGAIQSVMLVNTLIPGILGILAVIFASGYPLTRSRFDALTNALALKKEGKEYTTEGFERLL
jgi:GPH family glycoside/pentoside/hexuronide:cation symporter